MADAEINFERPIASDIPLRLKGNQYNYCSSSKPMTQRMHLVKTKDEE